MYEILNELSETVYVSDLQTYELLFLNDAGREFFHIDTCKKSNKCYEVLRGRSSPCPFCTNAHLSFESVYEWEYTNPLSNHHYLLKDKLVHWTDGKIARMEIALDITEQTNRRIELEKVACLESFIINSIKILHRQRDINENIQELLASTGIFLHADRVFILEFNELQQKLISLYEWCASGISSGHNLLMDVFSESFKKWESYFVNSDFSYISDITGSKEYYPQEFKLLAAYGVSNLVAVPLIKENGSIIGILGAENIAPTFTQQNMKLLFKTLAFFVVAMFIRQKYEIEITKRSFSDDLTGLQNRNKFIQDMESLQCGNTTHVGIAYIDVNGLKQQNDRYGHDAGDTALKTVAERLLSLFRKNNLYRIGGDEFVIVCPEIPRDTFAQKITDLTDIVRWGSYPAFAIGWQWFERVLNMDEHLKDTDALMYRNKKAYYEDNCCKRTDMLD